MLAIHCSRHADHQTAVFGFCRFRVLAIQIKQVAHPRPIMDWKIRISIFSESDEVELAREIKSIMKENDFSFEGRNGDDSKPEDGIYMKAQRFSKFYEMEE